MREFRRFRRVLLPALLVSLGALLSVASGRADIIEVEAPTGCPGSVGGGLCNGSFAYDLGTLVGGGISNVSGTEKFVVTDTTGNITFLYTGSAGDNGSCQINGGAATFFSGCTGTNTDGTVFSLGHDLTNHPGMNPPTLITFTARPGQCTILNPCTVDLGFISWQGTGTTTGTVPEPGTLSLIATGLFCLIAFARRKVSI
jgi:PEP-CTERM motif